jgi:dethiobiotin synthetase
VPLPPGVFVTGTDTGVGKTVLAAALVAALHAEGRRVAAVRTAAGDADAVVVEGVGGLLVPFALDPTYAVRELAVDLGLPLLVAARPGLGTINHTLLTVEAARAAGLDVRAVVLTPWPAEPTAAELDNRRTIAGLADLEVAVLPRIDGPEIPALAAAGRRLPFAGWLGG